MPDMLHIVPVGDKTILHWVPDNQILLFDVFPHFVPYIDVFETFCAESTYALALLISKSSERSRT